jgi:hypothetical protein
VKRRVTPICTILRKIFLKLTNSLMPGPKILNRKWGRPCGKLKVGFIFYWWPNWQAPFFDLEEGELSSLLKKK